MTTRTTPAVVFPAAEQIEIREVTLPSVGPHDVLVRSHVTAVSIGTELMVLRGSFPNQEYPCVVGYQQVGTVEACGDEVSALAVGDRVVTSGAHIALECHSGCGMAHAGHLVAPAEECLRLPAGVPDSTGVYAIMAAVGLLGYQKCGHLTGRTVAVTGLGLIGQFAAQIWREGGNRVYASDLRQTRVDLAARYSADVAFCGSLAAFDQRVRQDAPAGADVLVETSGATKVFDEALMLPRQYGMVCVQGHYPYDLCFSFRKAHWKQLRMEFPCAWGGLPNMRLVLGMMATGVLAVEPLITHRLPYTEAPAAYRAMLAGDPSMLGVVFTWDV
ncbi:MAG: zinc-dependent alcohol dehydrogenase [Anaerolineae bacterium]